MKAFLCHTSEDSRFVIEVAKHLERNLDGMYYFEEHQKSDEAFTTTISEALNECQVMVIFVGEHLSNYQIDEAGAAFRIHQKKKSKHFFIILLPGQNDIPEQLSIIGTYQRLNVDERTDEAAFKIAQDLVLKLERPWYSADDLPLNPHLFDYEKDIIKYFTKKTRLDDVITKTKSALTELEENTPEHNEYQEQYLGLQEEYEPIRKKQLEGCPAEWPAVVRWGDNASKNQLDEKEVGKFRSEHARVVAAALSNYHCPEDGICMVKSNLCFPEAGPKENLTYPQSGRSLNVAVLVSGGIAPGTNAVIDGITRRHHMYAEAHGYRVQVFGFKNGFHAFDGIAEAHCTLISSQEKDMIGGNLIETSEQANKGGSILGTSRFEDLMGLDTRMDKLELIASTLLNIWQVDILYVIGGDGSMKAAHAIWSFAKKFAEERQLPKRLSVVAIPKTMDNDILWVWQSFGFLSAVEKAREVIEHLATEVRSNPRLGVVQLFGSDSGFVVSHAVLASRTGICDAALIPEVNFSMKELATYLKIKMCKRLQKHQERMPYGFIVLAETAIPTDAMDYIDDPEIGLSEQEKTTVRSFDAKRQAKERIQGQTDDALRDAGLKIVSKGLGKLLPQIQVNVGFEPDWNKLRVFTNAPRHLLRTTRPISTDIIAAQRLGILAVDNALAGYTDFMVSQWLTEYVLVPLKLVVLGRKRIPESGIFWKSVLAKTGQPFDMV